MWRSLFALVFALLIPLFGTATADAATSITVGGSCKLSANWTVYLSARFYNTSGSPSRGYLKYVVARSDGPLQISSSSSTVHYEKTNGSEYDVVLKPAGRSGGDYLYTADVKQSNVKGVWFIPIASPSGFSCFISADPRN